MSDSAFFSAATQWLLPHGLRLLMFAGIVASLLAAGCSQLAQKERELTFSIAPGTASWYGGRPDEIRDLMLPVSRGDKVERMHAWWWPGARADAPAVLYLHGARWNLTGQLFRIEQLHEFGFAVLAIDYRGFGESEGGLPSEKTVYEDAHVAWHKLVQLQPDASKRFIYGHSLGGAIAIDLASGLDAHNGAHGLIVESSFTTLADVARALTYPWLPLQLLLSQKFDSVDKIGHVHMPVLIVHGTADRYVPSHLSQDLYDAAPEHKRLLLVPGGTHNNAMRLGAAGYRQAFRELFGIGRAAARVTTSAGGGQARS